MFVTCINCHRQADYHCPCPKFMLFHEHTSQHYLNYYLINIQRIFSFFHSFFHNDKFYHYLFLQHSNLIVISLMFFSLIYPDFFNAFFKVPQNNFSGISKLVPSSKKTVHLIFLPSSSSPRIV